MPLLVSRTKDANVPDTIPQNPKWRDPTDHRLTQHVQWCVNVIEHSKHRAHSSHNPSKDHGSEHCIYTSDNNGYRVLNDFLSMCPLVSLLYNWGFPNPRVRFSPNMQEAWKSVSTISRFSLILQIQWTWRNFWHLDVLHYTYLLLTLQYSLMVV